MATGFKVVSDSEVTAVAPPGRHVQDVMVVTPSGISAPGRSDFYALHRPIRRSPVANTPLIVT